MTALFRVTHHHEYPEVSVSYVLAPDGSEFCVCYQDERGEHATRIADALNGVQPTGHAATPPYPFCCHPDKCIATGRCERRVGGELHCCAD